MINKITKNYWIKLCIAYLYYVMLNYRMVTVSKFILLDVYGIIDVYIGVEKPTI